MYLSMLIDSKDEAHKHIPAIYSRDTEEYPITVEPQIQEINQFTENIDGVDTKIEILELDETDDVQNNEELNKNQGVKIDCKQEDIKISQIITVEICRDELEQIIPTDVLPKKCGNISKDKQIYTCSECKESFLKKIDFNRHLKENHSSNKEFVCQECNQIFSQAQTLARHSKIHFSNSRNKLCTFCGKCFMRSDDLKRHIRIHTNERPYACDQCPKKYKQTSELKEHQKSHSNEKNYMCSICGKSLATRNGLYVHLKAHRGVKNHECTICGNKYVTSGELTSHTKHIHSKIKPFPCTYEGCDRAFVTKMSLKTHLQTHDGKKLFQCPTCNKCLSTASSLIEHKRTHTGIKRKQCELCDRKLGSTEALKKHMRMHSGERPYQCTICAQTFICNSSLRTHITVRHEEKKFECLMCGKKFSFSQKLRMHMRVHAVSQPCCHICGLIMQSDACLQDHMSKHDRMVVWLQQPLAGHPNN